MRETFNANQYWLKRGQTYAQEGLPNDFHQLQERFLVDILRASRIPMKRILEVGCGFGRITKVLADAFPKASILAIDLSAEQLENARRHCASHRTISFQHYDFYSPAPFPGSDYDVAIAVEVWLHHPRLVVYNLFRKLSGIAGHLINIDWSEEWPWKTPEHVWVHDYASVYSDVGLQCAAFELPEKVDGLQQKLFIAARKLSPVLIHLEERVRKAAAPTHAPVRITDIGHPLPDAAIWPEQLELAVQDIRRVVRPGAKIILVNDDQWGNESRVLNGYRVLPFLERDGQYWGMPEDDAMAQAELTRLREAGATYLIFAWSSFWWLDHYRKFHEHLRATCELVLSNERLVVFRMK